MLGSGFGSGLIIYILSSMSESFKDWDELDCESLSES